LDPSSLNVQTFTLADASGTAVPASVSYDNSSYVATLTPTSPLQPGTTYTGRLTSGVRSWEGSQLAPSSFRFTTLALVVSQTAPVDGATDVDVGSTASATFSGPIDPASLTAQSFSLRDESGSTVPATIAYDAASITATLTPTSPLRYNTRYTATLTTGIRTPGGSGLARDYSFGFRTKSLLVTQVSPAQGATSIGSMATVKATFSAAADPSTLTTDTFALKDAGGTAVQATIAYDSSSKTATLTPSSPLRPQTTYTATLTGAIRGADGSTLANPSSWSFTTASCPCSLFPANPTPSLGHLPTRDGRGGSGPWSYELGVKIQVTSPVQLTAIRFYKDGSETGTHVGTVWSSSGAVLARTTFSGETASGWQLQALTAPLTLQPGQVYVVSVGFNAYFGETPSGLLAQITQGPLQSVADGRNGVYGSAAGVFPNQTYRSTSYLVDPVVR
ncbi:MAG: Ig-like domain-containing protein, partial [Gaiellaceae bacterium]